MIHLIGFTLLILSNQTTMSLDEFYQCSCENLLSEEDCFRDFCDWNIEQQECTNKSCDKFNKGDCEGVPDPFNCIWNSQTSKCEDFTQCSDYSFPITKAYNCYSLIKCSADVNSVDKTKGTIKCIDKINDSAKSIANCDNIPYNECNWLVTDEDQLCGKNKQQQICEAKIITQCSDYETIDNCDTSACYWSDKSCKTLDCSKLSENSCQFFLSFDSKNVTLCTWKDNKCTDLVEPENLKQNQCLSYTIYSYAWDPETKKCKICQNEFFLTGLILLALCLN